ncbi:MAG: TIGR03545 family protein [Burkholderiales bacterium]|nr:TIGR03545 family protein [Burkholderiales bacterium]
MKIIRIWGIAAFLVLIALGVVLWYLLAPKLIKSALEESGSSAIGAKMDIENVSLKLFPLGVEILNLQATDADAPMTNLVEIDSIRFGLDSHALLWKKVFIEELSIEGVQLNTARSSSGEIAGLTESDSEQLQTADSGKFELPEYSKEEVKAIVENAELITVKKLTALQTEQKAIREYWSSELNESNNQKKLEELQAESKRLIARAKENKLNLLTDRKAWKKLKKDIKTERNRLSQLNQKLKQDKSSLLKQVKEVKSAPQQDIDAIVAQLGLGNGIDGLSDRFLGPQFTPWVNRLLKLTSNMGDAAGKDPQEDTANDTALGRKVEFEDQQNLPDLLISKAAMSGKDANFEIDATGLNLGYFPWLVEQPASVDWTISGAGSSTGKITSSWKDRNTMNTNVDASVSDWSLNKLPLITTEKGAWLINSGQLDAAINGNMTLDSIAINLDIQLKQPKVGSPENLSGWQSSMHEALNKQQVIDIKVTASGSLSKPKLSVSSSLDKLFKQAIGEQLKQKADRYKDQIKDAVMQKTGDLSGLESGVDFNNLAGQLTDKDALLEKLLGGF